MSLGQTVHVALQGQLTIVEAMAQREHLIGALPPSGSDLVLDLGAIEGFDSAGVQLLLATQHTVAAGGGVLRLQHCPPVVAEVLSLYELQATLPAASNS